MSTAETAMPANAGAADVAHRFDHRSKAPPVSTRAAPTTVSASRPVITGDHGRAAVGPADPDGGLAARLGDDQRGRIPLRVPSASGASVGWCRPPR